MLFPVQQIHSNFKLSCYINRGHNLLRYHKISSDTLITKYVIVTREYRFLVIIYLSVLQDQTSMESL